MKSRSNPREWLRQEDAARLRYQRKMRRVRSKQLNALYVVASLLAVGVAVLVGLLAA